MQEHAWYDRKNAEMEKALWQLRQRSRTLQEYRRNLRAIWQDTAADEINKRYFDPHEDDSATVSTSLNQQISYLQQSSTSLKAAHTYGLTINNLLNEVEAKLSFAQQDISISHSEYDHYKEKNSIANSEIPVISKLLEQIRLCGK